MGSAILVALADLCPYLMRILHVVPTYFPAMRYGGPIRSVHGLAAALVQRGHVVDVYTTSMDGPYNLDVPLGVPVPIDGVSVTYFPVPVARRLAWSPALTAALQRSVATYDVVHLHSVFLLPTRAAARAAFRHHVPYVASPRGMLMQAAVNGRSRWLKRAWIALVERKTYRQASLVHVTAALEAAELEHFGVSPQRLAVIENGLDVPHAHTALGDGPFASIRKPYALFLSRISWKKGIDRLIRAWRDVQDLHLVIAGTDDEGYQKAMMQLCASEGMLERVSFVGPATDAHKWALYAQAEMFVLPSYAENFGNVVVEAMAMSCPVVVSDAVGAAALLTTAGAGLVNSGEPQALAADLNHLHADAGLRAAMGRRGRDYVEQHLGWAAIAARMEASYALAIRERAKDAGA